MILLKDKCKKIFKCNFHIFTFTISVLVHDWSRIHFDVVDHLGTKERGDVDLAMSIKEEESAFWSNHSDSSSSRTRHWI